MSQITEIPWLKCTIYIKCEVHQQKVLPMKLYHSTKKRLCDSCVKNFLGPHEEHDKVILGLNKWLCEEHTS